MSQTKEVKDNTAELLQAQKLSRYQLRQALLLQLYAHEAIMVIYGDLAYESTVKALKEKEKENTDG